MDSTTASSSMSSPQPSTRVQEPALAAPAGVEALRGGSTGATSSSGEGDGEQVHTIYTAQRMQGLEAQYLVSLEAGSKKVKRSHSELQRLAPKLLAKFLANEAANATTTDATTDATSSDLEMVISRPTTGGKGLAGKGLGGKGLGGKGLPSNGARAQQQSTTADEDDSLSDIASEQSFDDDEEEESEEDEESGSDFLDDEGDDGGKAKKKAKKLKSPKKGGRRSTRETRHQKPFTMDLSGTQDSTAEEFDDTASTASGTRKSARDSRKKSKYTEEGSDDDFSAPVGEMYVPERSSRGKPRKSYGEDDYDFEEEHEEQHNTYAAEWETSGRPQDKHRSFCARCEKEPVPQLLAKIEARRQRNKGRKRRKKADADLDEDTDQEEDRVTKLGAWIECNVCVQSYHFGCMPGALRKDFTDALKDAHLADHNEKYPPPPRGEDYIQHPETGEWMQAPEPVSEVPLPPREKIELNIQRKFDIPKCWTCKKVGGRRCFVCGVSGRKDESDILEVEETNAADAAAPAPAAAAVTADQPADAMDVDSEVAAAAAAPATTVAAPKGDPAKYSLMFRCTKCKRPAHYGCLELPTDDYEESVSLYFDDGQCHECYRWQLPLDVILAWAEDDSLADNDVIEEDDVVDEPATIKKKDPTTGKVFQIPSSKNPAAKAKYLVKWQGAGYRQLAWVPHAFLVAAYQAKLSNFLQKGSPIAFEVAPVGDEAEDGEDESAKAPIGMAPLPDPTAEERIPKSWRTPDRVLDVWYFSKAGANRDPVRWRNYRNLPEDPEESIKLVAEVYFKWGDLPYGASTLEVPPQPEEEGYAEFVHAYKAFLDANSQRMKVPVLAPKVLQELDRPRAENKFTPIKEQPSYLVGGKLMPFQMDGVNFLFFQWWKRTGCILADEMGLGKTVQIITLLSVLNNDQGARPFLVTVPNSTIGNWVREFERWAPSMRVVPYSGDVESRRIIEEFELFDASGALKTHVVLATYEALEKNIHVFRNVQRWDCLVVDEGQRLKSGPGGHLWDALETLNINHRVLLSGTPLNNNLTELFNLLNFIDPGKWHDQEALTERYAELTPEKVEEVRGILKPYFLRRTKDLVLNLPPLTEIVVPVSMSPLQRQIYRGILERNASAIESIFQKAAPSTGTKAKARKTNFNNVLMELRKTLCHPYIISPEIEPRGQSPLQEHANLTEASAKFVLLATMLPKLHKAGHRVLIFSQFKLTLNIIESFLTGLKLKFLRLDGDTKQLDRQRGIDDFNAPGSEYFCYLLSTRAGGVGINLTTADTVIMYDQDFNPHQDIQAIARAHRIGQKKPVRVFKLLVKGTCEEKIFNAGNKKLGLDHLIIQRIDAKDESEDVEGILQYGAKAIFDDKEAEANAINYTESDVEALLTRTAEPLPEAEQDSAGAFAHAKIWEKSGKLEDVVIEEEEETGENLHGFWAGILDKQEAEERRRKAEAAANVGRGKRSRATVAYKTDSPAKKKKKVSSDPDEFGESSGDDFMDMEKVGNSEEDSGSDFELDLDDKPEKTRKPRIPDLARLDEPAGPKSRKGRSSFSDPPIAVPNKEARDARRRQYIATLAINAARFNDEELNATLTRAQSVKRLEQTLLMEEATRRIHELAGPLVQAAAAAAAAAKSKKKGPAPKEKKAAAPKAPKAPKEPKEPKAKGPKKGAAKPSSTAASTSAASTPAGDAPDPATTSSLPVLPKDKATSAKEVKAKTGEAGKKEKLKQSTLAFGAPPQAVDPGAMEFSD
ncbi:hypothetical protein BCR35DRAFT_299456 [Leucosporidium creatinivorum]|uniref:SNF2 family N-terminal domain-domain-containing protein n=1 Tax=Leucosporidium creatinivorum TaxID=106004 RepID=A0A1Y2G487_9BASI|nr:hypothetical protein BCR35DRAFT_299456 [Leucosporidium creatinivorum]